MTIRSHVRPTAVAVENRGCVALARGPLLYCAEQVDNPGMDLRDMILPPAADVVPEYRADLLDGVVVLRAESAVNPPDPAWAERLYRTARPGLPTPELPVDATFVPYYAWANREPGSMRVWIPVLQS